ncbi:hypothetical protein HOL63_03460 [Candidatus Peregrinibacteria bacterium]|jgi:hypothetical protein|nr:hypothetical protein [Candidatus Peregrinibacteria bacterium]MBT5468819.1 hypothetical protein [Candidatus Peregrinibacteria bacterium]MBT7337184.1 hypothetical protein [Candidatus Peregrinibacteria bacterium]
MTDSMLWISGKTVLSTEKRVLTNEILRSQGICVIEVQPEDMQKLFQQSRPRFQGVKEQTSSLHTNEKRTSKS